MPLLGRWAIHNGSFETLEVLIEWILWPLYLRILLLATILVKIVELIKITGEISQICRCEIKDEIFS